MDERPVVVLQLAHANAVRALAELAPVAHDLRLRWDPTGDALDPATVSVIVTDRSAAVAPGVRLVRTTDPNWVVSLREAVAAQRPRSDMCGSDVEPNRPHPLSRDERPRWSGLDHSDDTDVGEHHHVAAASASDDAVGTAPEHDLEVRRARLVVIVDLGSASSVAIALAACAGRGTLLVDVRDRPTLWFLHDLAPELTTTARMPERPYELAPPHGTLANELVLADPLSERRTLRAATRSFDLIVVVTDARDHAAGDERSTALRSLWRDAQATVLAGACRLEDRYRILTTAVALSALRRDLTVACVGARGASAHSHATAIVRALSERVPRSVRVDGFGLEELGDQIHERRHPIPDRLVRPLRPVVQEARSRPPFDPGDPDLPLAPLEGLRWLVPEALEAIYHTSSDGKEAW
ncbi:hypothetical protein Afer_1275 [Acidimicrobium ferrooxidans DSM 10331]|uniref:Uncharacterized protein n=1 Tax=Acidimicrobium ferrooxidans (strain DSM 10331 / JCM 15462 / NBRC 103882 / ICP) TaxID=525909 RepID=C7LZP8_ACIFD|nr:hypothetical protein [Acidimicrobium ferrooxidans]ACU54206.1 hypothetical protein Afer_1275 [Acidimicrobium ferrooxidans DSM 10331]